MPTFNLGKDAGDVQEPELMPMDWYNFEISADPEQEPNKWSSALANGDETVNTNKGPLPVDPTRTGYNIVVNLRTISDVPEFNGRPFRVWIPLPTEYDKTHYTPIGQTLEDSWVERAAQFASAFSGVNVDGDTVDLSAGMKGMLYVNQQLDQSGQNMRNNIDYFAGARPYDGGSDSYAGEPSE